MHFKSLGEFLRYLESIGEVRRIKAEVDPFLEVTEIAVRSLRENKPVLLFENVKGSQFPLVINVYGTERRIEHALGRHPEQIGQELFNFVDGLTPPSFGAMWDRRSMFRRILSARGRRVRVADSQQVVLGPNLDTLPIQTCWPGDGGKFVTLGQVFTYDPVNAKRNVGIYRIHVYDQLTTGMHWQIQKGGGFHYHQAEQLGQDLELAVALGTEPALLLASVAALPEGMDEVAFAAFLRGGPIAMTKGKSVSIQVPAQAEFILEGVVPQKERRKEGPFGDHFGHYSHSAPFPVFHVKAMTHRRNPVYPATVVGIPPMEDKFLGDATQQILGPLARVLHSEIRDVWAYYEGGFHNLLVVSVNARYKKEAMKTALGLLGTGQLSLTKSMILVSAGVDVRSWSAVLGEIRDHFDPYFDFVLLPKVPMDTLDFTSFKTELGSRMILDATKKHRAAEPAKVKSTGRARLADIRAMDRRILDAHIADNCFLTVTVAGKGRAIVDKLVRRRELQHLRIIAAVSEDVNIKDQENSIWGVFTRFDCERDVVFREQTLQGIAPIYKGVMGIDATWKAGYPEPLRMPEEVVKKVDSRWKEYWS
ncbi:MAG: UbiD family decarboxylase [Ignavibacteriales bacterium]|nr:UbiD family decarboxylase [Ignavibacteriales bacterium]